jgi:hypothetical protein
MELLTTVNEDDQIDLEVKTTDTIWRQIMAKDKSAAVAVLKGDLVCNPGVSNLGTFMGYFDTDN